MEGLTEDILVIIQGRMGSKRFPGKTLYPFKGVPSLEYLVSSVQTIFSNKQIYIATSTNEENNKIRDYCAKSHLNCYNGNESNVASRFMEILIKVKSKAFIRLNGDSPLFDSGVLISMLNEFSDRLNLDLVTTSYKSKFPSGMNAELIRTEVFIESYKNFILEEHFEHVTKFFYDNSKEYNILNLEFPYPDYCNLKFSFDTEEDKVKLEKFFSSLTKPIKSYSLLEKLHLMNSINDVPAKI
ncbi:MAG: hypothetical protein SFU98_15215 [Leptospiraceae bacterium]|nr:hypothetical protein [Leptospiraceae bacterium]